MATVGCSGRRSRSRVRARAIAAARPRRRDVAADGRTGDHASAAQEHPASPATREAIEAKTASPPATSSRSRVSHGTGRRDRPEIRGRAGDDDARGRSRSTTACGAGDVGAGFGGRGSRSSSTDTGTGTDNGIGEIGSGSEETTWRHPTPRTVQRESRLSTPRAISTARHTLCASSVPSIRTRTLTSRNRSVTGRRPCSDRAGHRPPC